MGKNNEKIYGNSYDKKEDALDVYKEELLKNNGDIKKTLLSLNKDGRMSFGFLQYFADYKECINYLGIEEDDFCKAGCIKWSNGIIERHSR